MTGHIIVLMDSKSSLDCSARLLESHQETGNQWELRRFPASAPDDIEMDLRDLDIRWDYPEGGSRKCPHTGLTLHAYKNKNGDPRPRIACFASHARLWHLCATSLTPLMVFEEDALFTRSLVPESLRRGPRTGWGVIGLNDPRGATRRAQAYHGACKNAGPDRIIEAPWVDNPEIPQGIAGNSAYYLEPWAARLLLQKAREIGGRPNDSLMCRQYFPWLGQSTTYYTKVSGRVSGLA